ncbi:MAG: DUF4339 domain-containing protein [Synergistaceae bacterium]|nr:DUF4339 domain-containing protein [Synergistaceae bacterium]
MNWLGWSVKLQDEQIGPISKKGIQELIKMGTIKPETRLRKYHDRTDYPAIKTEFSVCFPHESYIAATADARVPDYWMWIGVFAPLLYAFASYYMYFLGFEARLGLWMSALFILLMIADCSLIVRKGYKPPLTALIYTVICAYVFFCPMIYLYYRNNQLRRKQTPTWASAACVLLIFCMSITWPLRTNRDIEMISVNVFNSILQPLHPEITVECVSASVQKRLPEMKFEIIAHLSDEREIEITLKQSGKNFSSEGKINIPEDIEAALERKQNESKTDAEKIPE